MKTILEAIKIYNEEFIDTLQHRAETTPSALNKENHLSLISYIEQRDTHNIGLLLLDEWYQKTFGRRYLLPRTLFRNE